MTSGTRDRSAEPAKNTQNVRISIAEFLQLIAAVHPKLAGGRITARFTTFGCGHVFFSNAQHRATHDLGRIAAQIVTALYFPRLEQRLKLQGSMDIDAAEPPKQSAREQIASRRKIAQILDAHGIENPFPISA